MPPVALAQAAGPGGAALPIQPSVPLDTETICTAEGCVGPQVSREKTDRLIAENPGRFAKEDLAILKAYTVDHLDQAVRDAEAGYHGATDENRDQVVAHYHRVLNLANALAAPLPPPPPEARLAYAEYDQAMKQAEARLAKLPATEAEQERARIKDTIFARRQPSAQK